MKKILLLTSIFSLALLSSHCGQKGDKHHVYHETDSLINLTLELQARIGSPEIQRLHDFEDEIKMDLEVLSVLPDDNPSLVKYLELNEGLGQCVLACNQFHEEAYMLESSLREIQDQSQMDDANLKDLGELLEFEWDNYYDLEKRIDSSMTVALNQAEEFYSIKPEIEELKTSIDSVPMP